MLLELLLLLLELLLLELLLLLLHSHVHRGLPSHALQILLDLPVDELRRLPGHRIA